MAASRKIYYDKDGNKKVFIGDPTKAPRNYGKPETERQKEIKKNKSLRQKREEAEAFARNYDKKKQLKPFSKTQFPEKYIEKEMGLRPELKPGREQVAPTKRTPRAKPPPPSNVGAKREKLKLALKGGGRAYGRNS